MGTILTPDVSNGLDAAFQQVAEGDAHTLLQAILIIKNPQRKELAEDAAIRLAMQQQQVADAFAQVAMRNLKIGEEPEKVPERTILSVD
jgi:hypothetical protein